jgi:LemA protein
MQSDFTLAFYCLIGVAAVTVLFYNRLVKLARRSDGAFADIDVQLKHRHDLIPNLIETVKGFVTHERGVIDSLVQCRTAAMRAQGPSAQLQAEAALGSRLGQVLALVESYPAVQASSHFIELRRELADCENKIAAARRFFNMAVGEYNAALEQFPLNFIGQASGLHPRRFYDLGVERVFVEEAPAVKF